MKVNGKLSKQINPDIIESEVKFRTIAEQSPNMIFINVNGRVVYANKRCEKITGYSLREFYSPKFNHLTLTAPEYRELVSKNFKLHAKGLEVKPYEYALITKDGKKLNTILSTKLINYNGKNAILGTITDITEKKKAEEALMESEKKYRMLFEHIQDAIALLEVVRNKKGIIVDRIVKDANPAFINLASVLDLNQLKNKNIEQIFNKKLSKVTLPQIRIAMARGKPQSIETQVVLKGKTHDFSVVFIPLNNDLYLSRTTDITALKEQDRKKDEFISIASHELKTPLTSLMLYSQIVNKSNVSPTSYLKKMHKQIEKLNILVNELMDVSKVQANKLQLHKESFSIVELVKSCIDIMLFISSQHMINFSYTSDTIIFADKGRIEQVIINLLTNALKYSSKAKNIDVSLKTKNNEITLKVKDYGIGIERNQIKKIFDRFYRADGKSMYGIPGFGMGLYISKEIIRQHRGKIWVNSTLDKGTTFYFSLPVN